MQYCNFRVDEKPYCCWEEDLKKRNLSFIDAIDTSYFRYNANLHREQLNSEDKQNSAFSLRILYHHTIETLFSLVCASLQAPKCLYGWIQKSSIKDVRNITKLINSGSKDIFNLIGLNEVSWEAYSSKIFYIDENWSKGLKDIVDSYALFLSRL